MVNESEISKSWIVGFICSLLIFFVINVAEAAELLIIRRVRRNYYEHKMKQKGRF